MWALYLVKAENKKREKFAEFESILEAFRTGNEMTKEKLCNRYRVEKVSEKNES